MPTKELIRDVLNNMKADHSLRTVGIIGSYAEGTATEESELDLLVEFVQPTISLIKLNALKYDLEDALGLSVNVIHAPLPAKSMIQIGKVIQVLK